MNETVDKRVLKTKSAIKKAFVDLLMELSYDKISVSQIAAQAFINRNTFYLHYTDKDDLLDQLTKESLNRLRDSMHVDVFQVRHGESPEDLLHQVAKQTFESIEMDLDFYKAVLHDENIPYLFVKIHNVIRDHFIEVSSSPEHLIYIEFISSGILGLIRYWIMHPQQFTAEKLADAMVHIQKNSMRDLLLNLSHTTTI